MDCKIFIYKKNNNKKYKYKKIFKKKSNRKKMINNNWKVKLNNRKKKRIKEQKEKYKKQMQNHAKNLQGNKILKTQKNSMKIGEVERKKHFMKFLSKLQKKNKVDKLSMNLLGRNCRNFFFY